VLKTFRTILSVIMTALFILDTILAQMLRNEQAAPQ
jgi:hypothetical protein